MKHINHPTIQIIDCYPIMIPQASCIFKNLSRDDPTPHVRALQDSHHFLVILLQEGLAIKLPLSYLWMVDDL